MILNDDELEVQEKLLEAYMRSRTQFVEALGRILPPPIKSPVLEAYNRLCEAYEKEISEYRDRELSELSYVLESEDDLRTFLVKYRLASGMAQKELANKLMVDPAWVHQNEVDQWGDVSMEYRREVLKAMGLKLETNVSFI